MWDLDRSASRGMMTCRGLYIFTHESPFGNAPAHHLFERVVMNMHTELVMEIYRPGGEILRAKSLLLKPFTLKYKKLLEKAGKEVVQEGKLSDELKKQLEADIINPETYIKNANNYWQKQLAKLQEKKK